jgi:hypothetical protein
MEQLDFCMGRDGWEVTFGSYRRQDFIERSLVLNMNSEGQVRKAWFNSSTYGTVEWIAGEGLVNCHRWETEDEAREPSFLSYHYTSIFMDGQAPVEYAVSNILEEIRTHAANDRLKHLVETMKTARDIPDYYMPGDLGASISL